MVKWSTRSLRIQNEYLNASTIIYEGGVGGWKKTTGLLQEIKIKSNQITFIGLVSSENYYRRPRIITPIA